MSEKIAPEAGAPGGGVRPAPPHVVTPWEVVKERQPEHTPVVVVVLDTAVVVVVVDAGQEPVRGAQMRISLSAPSVFGLPLDFDVTLIFFGFEFFSVPFFFLFTETATLVNAPHAEPPGDGGWASVMPPFALTVIVTGGCGVQPGTATPGAPVWFGQSRTLNVLVPWH